MLGCLLLVGYDIGCSFWSTLSHSSLAALVKQYDAFCCVNAFHGYAHNYDCQRKNHPLVIKGAGLEDLEVMERVFSSSNTVARLTQYASPYHCHQFIDMHFDQWNKDKYKNTTLFIHNNYVQALSIISTETGALQQALNSLGASKDDIDRWRKEEGEYLSDLKDERPLWDLHALAYVDLLEKLWEYKFVL